MSEMLEAPERIWAERDEETGEKRWFGVRGMGIEYVRTDLVDPADDRMHDLGRLCDAVGVLKHDGFSSPSQLFEKCLTAIAAWNRRDNITTPVSVKVNLLEWDGNFAYTEFGLFYLLVEQVEGCVLEQHEGVSVTKGFYGSREQSKDAAQLDYEKRIRSALTVKVRHVFK